MSFILDALRKSETERQRQSTPGLVDAGYRPPAQRRGIWLPVLVVVLVANLVLMGVFWLRRDAGPAVGSPAAAMDSPPVVTVPDAGTPSAAAGVPATADSDSTRPESGYEATADMPAVEVGPDTETPQPQATAGGAPEAAATGPEAPSKFVTDALPTAEQLMASGALPMETLHLDIHVYSTTPAERFVFINMRKYAEGAQLAEGPRVEEITRDGVVLSQAGQRFALSRD